MPCVIKIQRQASRLTAKIQSTAANFYQHLYQRSSTTVRQQRSITKLTKNNTRTANSIVTGSLSTSCLNTLWVKILLKFKYESIVWLAFQKNLYSKTRLDGHITIREKRVLGIPFAAGSKTFLWLKKPRGGWGERFSVPFPSLFLWYRHPHSKSPSDFGIHFSYYLGDDSLKVGLL